MIIESVTPASSPTRLIGREHEVASVVEIARDPETRLLTLTGTGGVGKTRLALEAASQLDGALADGVRVVSLAPIAEAAMVASAVARAVGVVDAGDRPLAEQLAEALAERDLLLVLDNFEHLLEAASLVGSLIASCPALRVLATSRAPLRLTVEQEYEVPPLGLPAVDVRMAARDIERFPAIALFEERARSAARDFKLDDDNAAAVAGVCRALEGVPLAIELAAARLKLLPVAVLAERLREHPLDLLTGGPRDLPSRQRTLRDTIEWSYELLGSAEQRLLARLSVFRGGATLRAAEAVGGGDATATDILTGLGSLLDAGLIIREGHRSGDVRVRLLETIREYAGERLAESGEDRQVRNAHASTFLAVASGAEPKLESNEQALWLDRLETDHDNLRSALRWLLDAGKAELALRLAGSLAHFWLMRGYLGEGRSWLDEALASAGEEVPAAVRAKALVGAGILTHYQNDYGRAQELLDRALRLYRASGDRRGTATALSGLAMVIGRHRDPAPARGMYEEALAISRELGDDAQSTFLLERLGTVLWYGGDNEAARPLLAESEAEARRLQLPSETAHATQALGWLCLAEGDPKQARELLRDAHGRLIEIGDRWGAARAIFGLGLAANARGAHHEARERLGDALAAVVELNDRLVICGCLGGLASTAAAAGRMQRAAMLLAAAERLREALGASHSAYVAGVQEATTVAAREALGAEAFGQAWQRGRALSVTDAIAAGQEEAAAVRRREYPDGLTEREVEVLRLVASGSTDPEVAESLVVSVRTVHAHLRSVYRKIGVGSRSGATRYAIEHELV